MKGLRRITGIMVRILIFCVIFNGLNYIYVADPPWERILWHNFYQDVGKIDNLFLGSSHVYYDIDPFLLDELNGQYNFNLSTSGQVMNGTYYLLREADKYNDLSHVYIELYYGRNTGGDSDRVTQEPWFNWQNTDCMKWSANKLSYMLSITNDVEGYIDILIPFSRYREHLGDYEYIKSTIETKVTGDYEYSDEYEKYLDKGFRYSEIVYKAEDRALKRNQSLGENPMAQSCELYLRKAVEYCQRKDIPVTLFISPMYNLQPVSAGNYDNYINQMKGIAAEYGLDFYDFNLAKDEYFPIQKLEYFRDVDHLNSAGAALFTDFFYKVVSGDAEQNQKYFYDSYAQKLQSAEPEVYGIYYWKSGSETFMNVASNRESGMEYRIVITPDEFSGKEQYIVQDFCENKKFTVDDECGICTVEYRIKNAPDAVHIVEVEYQ
ncbi:MAG: hypothetical protein K2N73_17515 [Lachnospiraceae bacterium]|nr:hypothetical protein [Lachnospiraceae bacterium]